MFVPAHTAHHHGIPVYWADLDTPLTGTLTFAVGTRDEPVLLAGITHLLEHLIFRLIEPIVLVHDGATDEDSLTFFASGSPNQVAGFLNDISAAIARLDDLTEADIEREKAIVEAEIESGFHTSGIGMLTYRYGARDIGMSNFGAPATIGMSKTELIDWAQRWLTRDNASLSFTGPVPHALDFELPPGSPERQPIAVPVVKTPLAVESIKNGIALSVLVDANLSAFLGDALRHELLHRLRHTSGLIYSVNVIHTRIDNDHTQVDFVLDPTSTTFAAALKSGLEVLNSVAADGFSENAVTCARNECLAQFGLKNSTVGAYLDALALNTLLARPTPGPDEVIAMASSLTSHQLTEALRDSLPSLLVAFDGDEELGDEVTGSLGMPVDDFVAWQKTVDKKRLRLHRKGVVWRSKRNGDVPGCFLSLAGDHMLMQVWGEVRCITFSDVSVVGKRGCGCLELVDHRGRNTGIDPEDWHRGKELVEAILARCPNDITRAFSSHGSRADATPRDVGTSRGSGVG